VGVNLVASSKSSGSVKEQNHQHSRAASEDILNGYHDRTEENGKSHPKNVPIGDAAFCPNVTPSPSADTMSSPVLQSLGQAAALANSKPELSKTEKALDTVGEWLFEI
jgi:hypothetical protein